MQSIYLTFDYEVFLGKQSGGITSCLLEPTNKIISVLKKHNVEATFFVDFSYIMSIEENEKELFDNIIKQLKSIIHQGSSIQVHLHPHWFGFKEGFFVHDYSPSKIEFFLKNIIDFIDKELSISCSSYRAGSLDNSTLLELEPGLLSLGFTSDSSVLDENAIVLEELKQFKIGTTYYSPLFYWKLLYRRFLGEKEHKRFGEKGSSLRMPLKGIIKRILLGARDHISFDSTKWQVIDKELNQNFENKIILSHPKSMNIESLRHMDLTIEKLKKNKSHVFRKI